jgi:hypothetical protein
MTLEDILNQPLRFRFTPAPGGGYEGYVILGRGTRARAAFGHGKTKAQAIGRAAAVAEKLMQNPLIAAALPPGAPIAVRVLGKAAASLQNGTAGKYLRALRGPGGVRLRKVLGL